MDSISHKPLSREPAGSELGYDAERYETARANGAAVHINFTRGG